MVKVALQIKANLENVDELKTSHPNFAFFFKIKCTNCGEESEKWHDLNESEKYHEDSRSHGFSLFMKCKMCSRENSIDVIPDTNGEKFVILNPILKYSKKILISPAASYLADDSGKFKSIVTLDCRGIEPTAFDPRNGWIVKSAENGLVFEDVDLSADGNDWCEYDTKNNNTVAIYEFQSQFVKLRK